MSFEGLCEYVCMCCVYTCVCVHVLCLYVCMCACAVSIRVYVYVLSSTLKQWPQHTCKMKTIPFCRHTPSIGFHKVL